MRNIINISLPKEMRASVDAAVRHGRFASKSEFFRTLLRLWQEGELLKNVQASRKEYAEGKGRVLRSFKDLR